MGRGIFLRQFGLNFKNVHFRCRWPPFITDPQIKCLALLPGDWYINKYTDKKISKSYVCQILRVLGSEEYIIFNYHTIKVKANKGTLFLKYSYVVSI